MAVRSVRFARWLPWSVSGISVLLVLASLPLILANRDAPIQSYYGTFWVEWIFTLVLLTLPLVGALIASRRPDNVIGWMMLLGGLSFEFSIFASEYAIFTVYTAPGSLPGALFMVWAGSTWSWIPYFGLLGAMFLLFPNGRLMSARWRPALAGLGISSVLLAIAYSFRPGPFDRPWETIDNPYAPDGLLGQVMTLLTLAGIGVGALMLIVSAGSLALRFRQGHAVERQQLKWLALAAGLLAAYTPVAALALYVSALDFLFVPISLAGILIFAILPLSVGMAILRYRLYDIDRIISRTLAYAVLTAILAGVYLAGFLGIQAILAQFTSNGGSVAVAASTLVVFALFQPIRRRIQDIVDRRFNRSRYDAQLTVEAFAGRLSDEVDLGRVAVELSAAVSATVQPTTLSIWIRGAMSTSMAEATNRTLAARSD